MNLDKNRTDEEDIRIIYPALNPCNFMQREHTEDRKGNILPHTRSRAQQPHAAD